MRFNPIESIRELALHAQNSVENACISAKVAMSPAKSYDEIGSTDNSKGCESDHNESKAFIDNTDTLPHPTKKSFDKIYRETFSEVYDRIFDTGEDFESKLREEKKKKQNIITIKVISTENR